MRDCLYWKLQKQSKNALVYGQKTSLLVLYLSYLARITNHIYIFGALLRDQVLEYNLELDFLHCFYRKDNIVPFLRK